jgi:hypothetical protein
VLLSLIKLAIIALLAMVCLRVLVSAIHVSGFTSNAENLGSGVNVAKIFSSQER